MTQRIRGRQLQRIRAEQFAVEPLCRKCDERGIVKLATQVDHIVPLFRGGAETPENRQSLCDECHDEKTREDLGYVERSGATPDGMPMDPSHHWNR